MEALSPRPTGGGQKTLFVTFYSFKGGVGRTLAVLNVACILAGLGRDVLMIDFDLEAPGLTHFQDKQIEEGFSRQQPGLVDAIDAFLDDPWSSPLGEEEPSLFFERYVSSLDVPEGMQKGGKKGTLDLIPAGRLDEDYEGRMYDLNFEEMFEEGVGRPLFERMKDLIEESSRYDYILVDSRTGFSDEGSICTRFLGDYLIVLTGLNRQNVRGTARFLRQADVAERDETLALVASPVPMYYEDLRAERIEAAKEHISDRADLDKVQFVTQIPYHPVLALEEDPTVRSLHGTDLFESYEDITERLRDWMGDQPGTQLDRVLSLVRNGKRNEALSIFRKVTEENPEVSVRFLRRVSGVLVDEYLDSSIELLREGIETAGKLGNLEAKERFLSALSDAYARKGEIGEAIVSRESAVNVSRRLDDTHREAVNLLNLGVYYGRMGDLELAIQHQERALELYRENNDQRGEASALNNIGYSYLELDNVTDAIHFFEKACDLASEIDKKSSLVNSLANLGICYALEGDEEKALSIMERVEKVTKDLDDDRCRVSFQLEHARVLSHLDPRRALNILSDSWSLIQEHPNVFERKRTLVLRARLRLEVENDTEGAAEDAQKALDFYQEHEVASRWSREAEEILEKAQTHDAS
jgi:tetratricopeptide (TPR) repeat protein